MCEALDHVLQLKLTFFQCLWNPLCGRHVTLTSKYKLIAHVFAVISDVVDRGHTNAHAFSTNATSHLFCSAVHSLFFSLTVKLIIIVTLPHFVQPRETFTEALA